ncbi:MAG: hypothetical protein AAB533_00830 [Patescibacteria group bacterium]
MKTLPKVFDIFPVWVLALALAVGLLYAAPPVLIRRAAEADGRFFTLPNLNHLSDDAMYYFPRAREIYEGNFPIEMHVAEYKNRAWFVFPPLPQVVAAGFIALARGDVSSAVIGLILVFGAVNFLCFYAVAMAFLRSRLWAAATATMALFTHAALRIPAVFYTKGVALDVIANLLPRLRVPVGELPLVRIDDPLLTMPLYLISFLLLFRFCAQPTARRAAALGGTLAILSYVYLYYWVAIFAIAGVLALSDGWRAYRSGSYKALKPWLVFYGVFTLLFFPQIINFFQFRSLPGGMDYIARKGVETGRGLRLSVYPDYIFYALAAAAAFLLLRKTTQDGAALKRCMYGALAGMALLWNIQILVGFNMEPFHWWKTFAPLLFLLSAVLVKAAYERMSPGPRARRAVMMVLVMLILSMYWKKALNAAAFVHPPEETARSYSVPRSIAASWEWINAATPPGSAVISNSLVSGDQISIFTHADPWMPMSLNSIAPTETMERRFAEANKILGASADEMLFRLAGPPFAVPREYLCPAPCAADRDRFRDRYELIFEFYPHDLLYAALFSPAGAFDAITRQSAGPVPPEVLDRVREYYAAYQPRPEDFPRHTYVYVGPWERLLSKKAGDAFAGEPAVFANEDVRIYRIR